MTSKTLSLIMSAMLMLTLWSCSGENKLLDTVPADAPGIVTVNVEKLMDAMDGVGHGGKLTSSEVLDKFLINSSERCHQEITAILTSPAIDRGLMAGFALRGDKDGLIAFRHPGEYVYTFKIINREALLSDIGASPKTNSIDGYDVYALEDVNLIVRGNQGWIIWGDPSKAVSRLSSELDRAGNRSAASLKGLSGFLSDDDDILHLAIARSASADGWTCFTGDVENGARTLQVKAQFMNADGKTIDMDKYIKRIDSGLLDYTAPSDMFVMALGISGNTDWDALLDYIQSIYPLDYRQRAFAGMILPYLKRLDGTMMIAAGTDTPDITVNNFSSNINFIVVVQLKKNEVKRTMSDLGDIFSMLGLPVVRRDNEFVMQSPGMTPVTLKAVDNSIVLTNRPLKQLGNDAVRKVAKGNSFAMWASIPDPIGEAVYGGRGFNMTMEVEDDFEMNFSFNGIPLPVLEQIAMIFAPDNDAPDPAGLPDGDDDLGFTPIDTIR